METERTPKSASGDHAKMAPYWKMVTTILGGADAVRAAREYLPKFPDEKETRYEARRKNAKFTNVFGDIVGNLAQRPFSKPVALAGDGLPAEMEVFQDDVDGQGNHLHVFAGDVFFNGIANAIDWILVDYTSGVPDGATREQERRIGARPYWVRIPAQAMLAVYSDMVDGREQVIHARFIEPSVERDEWGEIRIERVRVLTRDRTETGYAAARFELWEETTGDGGKRTWDMVDQGPITIGEIPLVPFIAGRREGASWCINPPMRDAADLQIELYQQESALKYAKAMTAFPMLAGNGVAPPMGDDGRPAVVPVGPHQVLYAPPGDGGGHGEWTFIEPSAESLKFLASDIKETILQLRELGRQPLTAQSGNLTVVTTAVAAQKGNAAIQAWALNLKDALENAFIFTAKWLGIDFDPSVTINTDFDLGFGDERGFEYVMKLYEQELISREAAIHEAKRRSVLDPDFDADADLDKMLAEMGGSEDDDL